VGYAPDSLEMSEMVIGADVGAALKEHVLEQMCEARSTGPFVLRSDAIPEVDRGEGQASVHVEQHAEAVGQAVLRERNRGARSGGVDGHGGASIREVDAAGNPEG